MNLKRFTMRRMLAVGTTALLLMALMRVSVSRADDEEARRGRLPGSWVVAVTPDPIFLCNGPQIAPAPPAFTELATFDPGGGFTETNTILNANSAALLPGLPFNGSDGHGTWAPRGEYFRVTFKKLVFDTA